ncbi:MAG: hypothetical protein KF805_05825 [Phycisphaeraceae bacterium]|nr:hypothetical protein [Phycisphaeraceae bacterium]
MAHRGVVVAAGAAMVAAWWCLAAEQHIVLPATFANTEGAISNNIPIASGTGTFQVMYSAGEMSGVPVNSRITGFQLRQDNILGFTGWPRNDATITDFRVFMGKSLRTPATFSNTFADNIIEKELVRSGALMLAKNAYPGGPINGPPRAWGPVIPLDSPYTYHGGPLVIEFRTSGAGSAGGTACDATTNSAAAAGGGNATSPEATTSNGGSVSIIRLTYVPPGCPADLNQDGFVDDADFPIFVAAYNILDCADPSMPGGCPADLNVDGFVDDADFVEFVVAYNELVCP